jgi:hypothetical protein
MNATWALVHRERSGPLAFPDPNPTPYNEYGTSNLEGTHAAVRRSHPPYELH